MDERNSVYVISTKRRRIDPLLPAKASSADPLFKAGGGGEEDSAQHPGCDATTSYRVGRKVSFGACDIDDDHLRVWRRPW